ncbi:NACHT domain-containing protein [Micromonospora sp. CA-259024]|uniref:NACHT domain-containing protein n=1 Tax=Micromonospora sp. CA-259024 TaxID=3239965 RepID=UPI003D8D0435
MRRRGWKWGSLAVVAVLAAGGTAWVWLRYDFEKVNWTWGVVAGVIAVYVLLDQVFRTEANGLAEAAAHRRAAADELVELIRRDPTDEALLRTVDEPYPLPVRWRSAPDRFLPSWRAIGRSSDAVPLDLAGGNGTPWSCYRGVPSGRLLLLGPAGSGKSIIALRMARELPLHREPDAPVPALVPADSWDPDRETFHDWLVDRIARRYPQLAAGHPRRDAVLRDLVETDLLVPVLDGLDEVPEDRLIACLDELNALPTQRFVLTCRTSVYERYLTQGEKLRGAAVVMLEPPSPTEVADYLVDAAPLHQLDNWSAVADALDATPQLTAALSTPLMVSMARSAFDQPGTDPRDLVPLARERGRRSVEDDLLTRAVDAALRSRRGIQGLRRWEPENARRYLAFVAAHLESLDVREFRWWQLATAQPGPFWALAAGVRTAAALWLTLTLSGDALTATTELVTHPPTRHLLDVLVRETDAMTVTAFLLAAVVALVRGSGRAGGERPRRVAFVGGLRALRTGLLSGLIGGAFWALVTFTVLSTVTPTPQLVALLNRVPALPLWPDPIRAAVVVGLLTWAYRAAYAGLRVDVAAPAAELGATSVVETVEADRAASVASALASAATGVLRLLVGVAALRLTGVLSAVPPLPALVYAGVGLGLGWWLHRRGGGAWMRFALTRAALAVRGRTPHRLLAFLAYAETVGLLRDGAGAYRFRHSRLQSRLAGGSVSARRGSRLREEFGVELARAGYWPEALGVFADVTQARAASIGHADDLTVAALRRALLAGAAAGEWTRLASLLALIPPPAEPAPLAEQRQRVARLIADGAPVTQVLVAVEALSRGATGVDPAGHRPQDGTAGPGSRGGRAAPGVEELLAVLQHVSGDTDAARARLDRLLTAARQDVGEPAPIGAGLLARLLTDDSEPVMGLVVCHQELLLADQPPDRVDLLLLAETWRWSVEVMRRNTDERAELRRRIRAGLAGRGDHPRRIELGRRELAEVGLQLCHALIEHQTLGPLAVAASRRLVAVLAEPAIVARTVSRGAPMWHGG